MRQFDTENALILLLARGSLSDDQRLEFEVLLSSCLDWDYLFTQMKRHQLFPLLAGHLQSVKLNKTLSPILQEVESQCIVPLKRSRILDAELCRIAGTLKEQGITYAVLKGPILAHLIYDNPSKRTYKDIDILIIKSDADTVCTSLQRQGYIQGKFDIIQQELVAAPRKDVLWCSMYVHQLYPFVQVIEQCLCSVDLQIKFFHQYANMSHNLGHIDITKNAECWQTLRVVEIDERKILTLNWEYFLLQICLHAYVDEVSLGGVVYGHGGRLRAYCDVREVIVSKQVKLNIGKFAELVQATGANQPVYYIFTNLQDLYQDLPEKVSRLLDLIRPDCLAFMNEFGLPWEALGKEKGRFSQPWRKRLFDNSCRDDYERQRNLFGDPNKANLY